ncbi:LysM peptidoglycan-binding domain-containing protein [Rhodanobacter hydrolyticus]|uniref:Substrate-binding domain-containing protein n=1 Tax=Rhodanobacter hydrolyticus TaxID=2250595 RepID=A0ABW8J8K8_9GAMM
MTVRAVRLLPVLLLGACLAAPAFAATTATTKSTTVHHKTSSSKSRSSKAPALIWRGDVTTARAVVIDMAKEWQRTGHTPIKLEPFNTASGIDAVAAGTADLAGSARNSDGTPEDGHLTFTPVAWDALVMIANPSNPVRNLTVRQLHDIYFGKITNWKDVGGKDAPIDLYAVISPNDGVEYSLRTLLFGHGDQQISAPRLYLNTKALEDGIALNPNGLGLSTLANVSSNPKLRTIPIDGVAPTEANVVDGSYPLYTPLYLVTNPNSTKAAAVKEFIDFLQGDKAKAVLRSHAVLPYQDGAALVAKDQDRRDKVYAESTASHAKAPVPSYAVVPALAPDAAQAPVSPPNADATKTASTAGTSAGNASKSAGGTDKTYTVVKGDTLSGIAQKTGVTVTDLRDWNHLKSDNIKLGQSLQLSRN